MELDARSIPDGTTLEADLCIVGAGPAGIALAREFIGGNLHVVILESGGLAPDEGTQELNEGAVVGDRYAGPRQTRYRGVGGSVHLWNTLVRGELGAKYVPLDPYDFEGRTDLPHSAWPFDYPHLEPFYRRAQALCGLGPFVYEGEYWCDDQHRCLPLDSEYLTTKVYQFGVGHLFTRSYPRALCTSDNIRLCYHATVCGLETEGGGRRVVGAKCSRPSGEQFRVRAPIIVLAGGAIENARLLLLSDGDRLGARKNGQDWVGRCFMEHLRDHALTLIPRSPELFKQAVFYDVHSARGGSVVGGRIALDKGAIRAARLPNASVTLLPRTRIRRRAMSYGWSHVRDMSSMFDGFRVLVNVEQQPNPENRIVLARERDPLGVPRVEVQWRWRREEQADLERLRTLLASQLEAAGLGQVQVRTGLRPDPNAHHHAGTTRMHTDPQWGVVDGDGRVHGTDNLFVTGGSTFCRAGFANPTLTIIALALRLADHLKQRI